MHCLFWNDIDLEIEVLSVSSHFVPHCNLLYAFQASVSWNYESRDIPHLTRSKKVSSMFSIVSFYLFIFWWYSFNPSYSDTLRWEIQSVIVLFWFEMVFFLCFHIALGIRTSVIYSNSLSFVYSNNLDGCLSPISRPINDNLRYGYHLSSVFIFHDDSHLRTNLKGKHPVEYLITTPLLISCTL